MHPNWECKECGMEVEEKPSRCRCGSHLFQPIRDVRGGGDCLDHQYVAIDARTGHCGVCHEREPVIETALVFDKDGHVIYWHEPPGRSGGSLPDSRSLWDILWEWRNSLGGIAHTHPWDGPTSPSGTDLSTFRAIEVGLGKRLLWPIITMTHEHYFMLGPEGSVYQKMVITPLPYKEYHLTPPFTRTESWKEYLEELRSRSKTP